MVLSAFSWIYFLRCLHLHIVLIWDTSGLYRMAFKGTEDLDVDLFFPLLRCIWKFEKLWQSSIWYSKVLAFVCLCSPACLIELTHSNSHCFSLFLLLSSLTVMPVTCELPGQGTSKRSLTTLSLGLTLIFAIRYVFECCCVSVFLQVQKNLIGSFCNQHTAASAEFQIQGSRTHV